MDWQWAGDVVVDEMTELDTRIGAGWRDGKVETGSSRAGLEAGRVRVA